LILLLVTLGETVEGRVGMVIVDLVTLGEFVEGRVGMVIVAFGASTGVDIGVDFGVVVLGAGTFLNLEDGAVAFDSLDSKEKVMPSVLAHWSLGGGTGAFPAPHTD